MQNRILNVIFGLSLIHIYQTYLSYQPNKRWKLDFIGYISDNHYNFEPEDRETKFGTTLNDVGRQTLLRYARGEVLDAIGERQDVKRLEGTPAKTTMRFSVSTRCV